MGIAAYLYFQNIKNLMILLVLLACFYCSYALYVNISEPSSSIYVDAIKKISFASTIQNLTKNTSLYGSMLKEGGGLSESFVAGIKFFLQANKPLKLSFFLQEDSLEFASSHGDVSILP